MHNSKATLALIFMMRSFLVLSAEIAFCSNEAQAAQRGQVEPRHAVTDRRLSLLDGVERVRRRMVSTRSSRLVPCPKCASTNINSEAGRTVCAEMSTMGMFGAKNLISCASCEPVSEGI